MQTRAARFVPGHFNYDPGSINDILGQLKTESIRKMKKDNTLTLLYKVLKCTEEITTQWHFRHLQLAQIFTKAAFSTDH